MKTKRLLMRPSGAPVAYTDAFTLQIKVSYVPPSSYPYLNQGKGRPAYPYRTQERIGRFRHHTTPLTMAVPS